MSNMLFLLLDADLSSDFLSLLLNTFSIHAFIYTTMIGVIVYLLSQKSYKPKKEIILTKQEILECVETWQPKPLLPKSSPEQELNCCEPLIEKIEGLYVTIDGKKCLNASSYDFLSFSHNDDEVRDEAIKTLRRYGTGTCGPRQFYGTLDVHMEFESKMSALMKTQNTILYASGFAVIASVIPAFSARADYILCDMDVKHSIQVGNYLSRSKVQYFKHNDLKELESMMKAINAKAKKSVRKTVIVEGIYKETGSICNLPGVLALCEKYQFRIILDDSIGLGTIGSGRGVLDHFNIDINRIDIFVADVSYSLSSLGGVCCGEFFMVNFQRLNGSGYMFSASNPPYLVTAGIASIEKMTRNNSELVNNVQTVSEKLHRLLSEIDGFELVSDSISPVKILRLDPSLSPDNRLDEIKLLQAVVLAARERGLAVSRAIHQPTQRELPPQIRVHANVGFSDEQVEFIASTLNQSLKSVLAAR